MDMLDRPLHGHDDGSDDRPSRQRDPSHRQVVEVDFYTVALGEDGQIVEENLIYDLVTFPEADRAQRVAKERGGRPAEDETDTLR
jgi:hypothetical protein